MVNHGSLDKANHWCQSGQHSKAYVCRFLLLDRKNKLCVKQVVKDYVKLTMTGPARAMEEAQGLEELHNSHVAVLVARHFEAMWVHMREGLGALPVPHHRLTDQVCPAACGQDSLLCLTTGFCLSILDAIYMRKTADIMPKQAAKFGYTTNYVRGCSKHELFLTLMRPNSGISVGLSLLHPRSLSSGMTAARDYSLSHSQSSVISLHELV